MSQRSKRSDTVVSPLALLEQVGPAHRAITAEMGRLVPSSSAYARLDEARVALDRVAAALGHPGRFAAAVPHLNR